jgi:hypothetical protein
MNTTIKRFIFYFVTATVLGLVAPVTHANLGDTEEQIKVRNAGLKIDEANIDARSSVIVFTDTNQGTQITAGILDGFVEREIFTNFDDCEPDFQFVSDTIHTYAEVWFPIGCDADSAAVMSANGKYFSLIGPSDVLRKKYAFSVFTDAWMNHVIERRKETTDTL